MQRIALLGSTGSIGTNTLQVVREMEDAEVVALAAGANVDELLRQALEFRPRLLSLADSEKRDVFWKRLQQEPSLDGYRPDVLWGREGNLALARTAEADVLVSAAVGVAGLEATYEAVRRGMRVALANKEVLVTAGQLVMRLAETSGAELLPVDSEHNGVHQCLRCGEYKEVRKLILTASGGPFRNTPLPALETVTPSDALNHPTWRMGNRITIDSATLMNKGFEVIEACRLFGLAPEHVEVVVHPQSIIHAMVEFLDGSVIAQLSPPDMKLPIRYALTYPRREPGPEQRRLDWSHVRQLEFEPPDRRRFPLLSLAYQAIEAGDAAGCVLNAADEVAVEAFLAGRLPFLAIPKVVETTLQTVPSHSLDSIPDILAMDADSRRVARETVQAWRVRAHA